MNDLKARGEEQEPCHSSPAWLPRAVFLLLLGFGTALVFLLPPFQAPDEASHLTRTIMLTEGQLLPVQKDGRWGQMVPVSLHSYISTYKEIAGKENARYGYGRWVKESRQAAPKEPRFHWTYPSHSTSPLLYLPQIAGVLAGKVIYRLTPITFNWPAALYSARFGNLLVFAILAALAIKALLRFRAVAAGLVLLPMTVHLVASASYDGVPLLAALWLLTIVTTVCVRGGSPTRNEIILLAIAAFFLGHAKLVYAPLLLTIVAMKSGMSWRSFFALAAGLFVIAAAGALSSLALFGFFPEEVVAKGLAAQRDYVLANLGSLPSLVFRSFAAHAEFYFTSFIGRLGWFDMDFAVPVLVFIWALLIVALLADAIQGPSPLGLTGSIATLAGAVLSVVALMLTLYLFWTPIAASVGAPVIEGVQGRYFLPIVLFVAAAIAATPKALSLALQPWRPRMIEFQIVCQSAILVLTVFVVAARHWIPQGTP